MIEAQRVVRTLEDHIRSRRSVRRPVRITLPAASYVGRDHLGLELASVFAPGWRPVALVGNLASVGDYVATTSDGIPIVVVRSPDGVLRALANVCMHRGASLLDEGSAGRCHALQCPYHGWTYDLEGGLTSVPDPQSFQRHLNENRRLAALPLIESGGVVWVDARSVAPAGDDELDVIGSELRTLLAPDLRLWRRSEMSLALNWKLGIETFLEAYHFRHLHTRTVGRTHVSNLCVSDRIGRSLRVIFPRKGFEHDRVDVPDEERLRAGCSIVYVLLPNVILDFEQDHLQWWKFVPDRDDPGQCRCDLTVYAVDSVPEAALEAAWEEMLSVVIGEDLEAMATVQRGMASGVFDTPAVGENEHGIALFHEYIAAALAGRMDEVPDA